MAWYTVLVAKQHYTTLVHGMDTCLHRRKILPVAVNADTLKPSAGTSMGSLSVEDR